MTGWSDADWVGKPLQAFIHPSDIIRLKDRYEEVLRGETVRFENVRCLMKNGNNVAWALSFVPQVEKGVVTEVLVVGHLSDLETNQASFPKNAVAANAVHPIEYVGLAKLLESMLGNAPIGFALLDGDLRIICLNQTFSEMTGFSPSQQLGQPLRDHLPKAASYLEPIMQNVLTTGESVNEFEVELQSSPAVESYRCAQISFYPIPDLHGGVCGVATIAVDITDRKHAEANLKKTSLELERSNLALAEFSYIASHDLREPLRTVSSFVGLLKNRYQGKLEPEANEFINFALNGAKRMQRLIDKILEYSKAGKVEEELSQVDCNAVLKAVTDDLKVALEESRGIVTVDPLPTVWGDQTLLLRIFQNLIANAIKYRGPAELRIHVSVKKELNAWVFSIADNGIGINSDQFLNIFIPFKKLHSQSEYAGSGLGLAICQKNVERLGGKIWVTSKKGTGSVFSFTLPVAQERLKSEI